MKTASIKELKDELSYSGSKELIDLCLAMARFKKENKELLTYLLFNASQEHVYIQSIKEEMEELFKDINTASYFYMKKTARKILRNTKKYIRYSKKKETEVELLLHYCKLLLNLEPDIRKNTVLNNLLERQMVVIRKALSALHEDLQYDFEKELDSLNAL